MQEKSSIDKEKKKYHKTLSKILSTHK